MKYSQCEACSVRVAWIGVLISLTLALMKYYIGWVGGSAGVVAAAIHSTVCMVSSASILFARSFTQRGADSKFQYGYGKIEFVASAVVSSSILVVITLFFISNIRALVQEIHHVPHVTAAVIAMTSVIANEFLYRYFRCVGKQMNSPTVTATAWAVRSDAFTSLVVLLGVIGTSFGIRHLDPIIAIVITLVLFKIVGENIINSIRGLMDYAPDQNLPSRIKKLLKSIPEVISLKGIKTRSMGQRIKVDLEVKVAQHLTLEEVTKLEEKIAKLVLRQEKKVGDISFGFVAE